MSLPPGHDAAEGSVEPASGAIPNERPPTAATSGTHAQPSPGAQPPNAVLVLVIILIGLLMVFSLVAALLGQTALALMAGTAVVGLVGEVIRRVLADRPDPEKLQSSRRRRRPPGRRPNDVLAAESSNSGSG